VRCSFRGKDAGSADSWAGRGRDTLECGDDDRIELGVYVEPWKSV